MGRFCFVRGISIWLTTGAHCWGEPLLDFLIWTGKVLGMRSPTLKTRFADIRFMRLVYGNVDFTLHAHRAKAMMKGSGNAKGRWENVLLIPIYSGGRTRNWAKRGEKEMGVRDLRIRNCSRRVYWVSFLLMISEIEALQWEDVCRLTVETGGDTWQ